MPAFHADFSNTTGPAQVTDGLHTATIEAAQQGVSSNNNIKIDLRWRIDESEDEANVGRKVFDTLTVTEAAFFRIAQLADACQLDTSSLNGLEVSPQWAKTLADLLLGETIVIETQIKSSGGLNPATGEPYPARATVKRYHPYGYVAGATQVNLLEDSEGDDFAPVKKQKRSDPAL